jgi:biopolymer transport protein ExbD
MQLDSGSRSSLQAEINITPLVDVVLVLLIIFMVVVPLMMEGYDVNIPRTSAVAPTQAALSEDSQVVLSIVPSACPIRTPPAEELPSNCRVILVDERVPASELPQRVADILGARPPDKRVLFLSADDGMNYEGVLRILDLARLKVQGLKIEVLTAR